MSTARDLLSASFRLIGVLASGEAMSSTEANDGLDTLNAMIDSWSTEHLMIPNKVREVFALTAGTQTYTMGSNGGDFNTTRPMWIENALIQTNNGSSTLELPMKLVTKDEWAGIILKQSQGMYPRYLYAEGTYPLETLNLWSVPNTSCNIVLYSAKQLAELATLDTAISLPPGYLRALRYNLAVELAPEYGRPISELVAGIALESKANIKRINSRPKYLRVDDQLLARSPVWNWMTGEPT